MELKFTRQAWNKLNYFLQKDNNEFGCWGLTSEDDRFLVEDILVVKQEVGPATVELDDDDTERLVREMSIKGIPQSRYQRVWIHTHPGNSATPSSVDWENLDSYDFDYMVMFIIAMGGETSCHLRIREFDIDVSIKHEVVDQDIDTEELDAIFEEMVTPRKFATATYGNKNNTGLLSYWEDDDSIGKYPEYGASQMGYGYRELPDGTRHLGTLQDFKHKSNEMWAEALQVEPRSAKNNLKP